MSHQIMVACGPPTIYIVVLYHALSNVNFFLASPWGLFGLSVNLSPGIVSEQGAWQWGGGMGIVLGAGGRYIILLY